MALDFLKPVTTDLMATILTGIKDMFNALVKMEPASASNLPTGAKQWSVTNNRWETWNGTAWIELMPPASTTVRGPTVLSNSVSSNSAATAATSLAVKTVQDSLTTGLAALNGSNITTGTVPVARLPAATTSAVGAVQLSSSVSSTSTTLAANPLAVKTVNDAVTALAASAANASNLSSGTVPLARRGYTAAVSGHVRSGNVQLIDGSTALGSTGQVLTSDVAEDTWESYGPTGSGATNIWSDLDNLPSSATTLIVMAELYGQYDGGVTTVSLYAASGDVASPSANNATKKAVVRSGGSGDTGLAVSITEVMIPLSAAKTFKVQWGTDTTSKLVKIYYKGFMTDE